MSSIGPRLPLSKDNVHGHFSLIRDYKTEIAQNLKNLLLTAPGERVMIPDFGVGLRHFLFEPRQHSIASIRQKIDQQVKKYMPFLKNLRVIFDRNTNQEFLDNSNIVSVQIVYDVPSLNITSEVVVTREDLS